MFTNKTGISLPMAVWLAHDTYDHNNEPHTISATSLLKPIRSTVLGMRIKDRNVDISDLIPSQMGTSFHTALEVAWVEGYKTSMKKLGFPESLIESITINPPKTTVLPDGAMPIYLEQRASKKMGEWTISGKFDMVLEGALHDLKSCGTYGYITGDNVLKYIQQGSIYRWLNQDIVTEDILYIEYLFTDWSKMKAAQDPKYPQSRILTKKYTLMSIPETENFIQRKLLEISNAMPMGQKDMPLCTSEELWEKASTWKYYKNPAKKSRSTKNFDNAMDANTRLVQDGGSGEVVMVKGEVVFCRYCSASTICLQAEQYIMDGRLVL